MEYNPRTYFAENEYDDVKGFTVLAADDGEYHIAEKWLRSSTNESETDVWIDYWVPATDLRDRLDAGLCERKATLTDEQFASVCEKVGYPDSWTDAEGAAPEASA